MYDSRYFSDGNAIAPPTYVFHDNRRKPFDIFVFRAVTALGKTVNRLFWTLAEYILKTKLPAIIRLLHFIVIIIIIYLLVVKSGRSEGSTVTVEFDSLAVGNSLPVDDSNVTANERETSTLTSTTSNFNRKSFYKPGFSILNYYSTQ